MDKTITIQLSNLVLFKISDIYYLTLQNTKYILYSLIESNIEQTATSGSACSVIGLPITK